MPKREGRRTIEIAKVLGEAIDRAATQDGFGSFAELVRFLLRDYLDKRLVRQPLGNRMVGGGRRP